MVEERGRHGYEIARLIEEQSHGAVRFHVASFYPLLNAQLTANLQSP
jgi:DNA-binding PadR family transcriptional regulator